MNDVIVSPFGKVAMTNPEAMTQKLQQSAQDGSLGGAPDGSEFLNFSGKRGVYEFGKDKESVDSRERFVVNIASFEDGYICWKGGKPASTRLANIYTGIPVDEPSHDELGPFDKDGEGWFKAKAMVLRSVDEDDKQGYFKLNSKSGVAVFSDLQSEVAARMKAGLDPWPVVTLGVEKFTAQGQTNYKPKFTIEGWLSEKALVEFAQDPDADIDDFLDPDLDDEPEPEPKRRRKRL